MKYKGKDIKVVWLDLDDTLIDFHANSRTALRNLYNNKVELQRLWPSADAWTDSYEKHNMALWTLYNRGEVSRDFLMMERFRRPLVEAGMSDSPARKMSPLLSDLYLDFLAAEKRTEPGAIELLQLLRSRGGVITGVLSNGFKEVQYRKMHSAGLDGLIDITVLSDDIGVNKPDIRLYQYAMERAGVPYPESHLMIGDNPMTDIAGAIAAGWSAIAYLKKGASSTEAEADFESSDSLLQIAEMLNLH